MREPVEHVHTNHRGERVRVLGWPVEGADTALFIHHGLGEHIGRYQTFADHLDTAIWGYDARGHGAYSTHLGHADGLGELAEDLERMIPVLLEQSGAKRFVLLGHSMGAATVLHYLVHHAPHDALQAVILSAPPVAVELDLGQKIKVLIGRLLSKITPSTTLDSGLNKDGISSIPAEVQRYLNDPLVHSMISLELARSLIDDAPLLVGPASRIDLPVLLLHGTDDPIALPRGSEELHHAIAGSVRQTFAGARHEVHHDKAADAFFEVVSGWLDQHLGADGK